jgi:plastocyanin
MNGFRCKLLLVSSCLMVACSQPATVRPTPAVSAGAAEGLAAKPGGPSAAAGSSLTATVQFGLANVGTAFPPTSEHDHSANAKDNLVPRTVVIDRGGTVTFETFGVHGVAIYAPGTQPEDVDISELAPAEAGCPPVPLINDQTNLLAIRAQPCAGGSATPSYTFTDPGRYLIVCRFLPHFVDDMYGWVNVR